MTNTNQIDILVFLCYISRPQVISKFNAKKNLGESHSHISYYKEYYDI